METEITRMSSKGQIVIPQNMREEMHAHEGTVFAIIKENDAIVLKKITMPSKEELIKDLKKIAVEGSKRAEKLGIKESDVSAIIQKIRKSR